MKERIIRYLEIVGISFGVQIWGIIMSLLGMYIGDHIWFGLYTIFDWSGFSLIFALPLIGYGAAILTGIILSVRWMDSIKTKLLCIVLNPVNIALPCFIYYLLLNMFSGGLW